MKRNVMLGVVFGAALAGCRTGGDPAVVATAGVGVYSLRTRTLEGEEISLSAYAGKVTLVVNVASECGLTPQYEGLEKLHEALAPQGFSVLAFPSNDFGGQEPSGPEQIRHFCTSNYGVTFPLFEKVQTRSGAGQSPIYAHLETATGHLPSWNFGKYVVSRDGGEVTYFDPRTTPDDPELIAVIEAALYR